MIECPCCHELTDGPICDNCGIGLPADWAEPGAMYHVPGPSDKPSTGYEEEDGEHHNSCRCVTCINLRGLVDPAIRYEHPDGVIGWGCPECGNYKDRTFSKNPTGPWCVTCKCGWTFTELAPQYRAGGVTGRD